MGLLDRASTLIRANLNDLISRAEDPEKVISQLLMDMQSQLQQVKSQVAMAITHEKRLYQHYEENRKKAEEWERKAELAVDKGNDELAREALSRRKSFQETSASFHQQWQEQNAQVGQLKEALRQLERKVTEAQTKKDLLIARHQRAKAETQIRETMAGIGKNNAAASFERIEERVAMQEARAKAVAELEGDTLDAQFSALERDGGIDDDLAALKARRQDQLGAAPSQPQLEGPR